MAPFLKQEVQLSQANAIVTSAKVDPKKREPKNKKFQNALILVSNKFSNHETLYQSQRVMQLIQILN